MLLLAHAALGFIAYFQNKYGVTPEVAAAAWAGEASADDLPGLEIAGDFWHHPERSDDNRGLGGGIAWAWDDELCKETSTGWDFWYPDLTQFEDKFEEDFFFASFITCKDIRASMHRAFQTWSDAHPYINFMDVTEECRRMYGVVQSNCSLVEIFITHGNNEVWSAGGDGKPWQSLETTEGLPYPEGTPYDVSDLTYSAEAAQALVSCATELCTEDQRRMLSEDGSAPSAPPLPPLPDASTLPMFDLMQETTSSAAASASLYRRYAYDVRSTNGVVQKDSNGAGRQMVEVWGGMIRFNIEQCWYLDSAFCSPLHSLKASMGTDNALAMLQGIAFGALALAIMLFLILMYRILQHQHCCTDKEHSCSEKAFHSLEELNSWGVLPLLTLLLMLWVPISLQRNIFNPCWNCFDFEAAAVHEIGHVLGLHHPDSIEPAERADGTLYEGGANVHHQYLASMDGINPWASPGMPEGACLNPWQHVVEGPPAFASEEGGDIVEDSGVRDSIMEAFTEHNPRVCLTPDDIEGLNVLYPVCTGREMAVETSTRWRCGKTKQNVGAVRVLVWIVAPIAFIMFLEMLILSRLKHHEEAKFAKKHTEVLEAKKTADHAHAKAKKHEKRANQAAEALELQIATEDSRVEQRAEELAAAKIQAHLRRKKSSKHVEELEAERRRRQESGEIVNHGETYDHHAKVEAKPAHHKKGLSSRFFSFKSFKLPHGRASTHGDALHRSV